MALITIATKSTLDTLTAAEFNQLLAALKDGTLEINPAGLYIGGTEIAGISFLADDPTKGGNLIGRDENGVITNMSSLNGDPNTTNPTSLLNIPFWVKKEIVYDDTSPVTIMSIGEGYVVHHVLVNVSDAWDDGSKAFVVGHGSDDNAFITDLGAALATPKFYGFDNTYWGVRLYNSTDKHQKLWVADGSYDLQAAFTGTGNGGSQGRCYVYIMLSRLY